MAAPRSSDEWIADLRKRVHDHASTLTVLLNTQQRHGEELATVKRTVSELANAKTIADEVERRLEEAAEEGRSHLLFRLTAGQKAVGLLFTVWQIVLGAMLLRGRT